MPSFADMLKQYDPAPVAPVPETPPVREGWDVLMDRWPPLNLPKPPEPLTLDWVWSWIFLEPMPSWPGPRNSPAGEHASREVWEKIEHCFEHGRGLPDDRLAWLREHEKEIRPLLRAAKAEHCARYPRK